MRRIHPASVILMLLSARAWAVEAALGGTPLVPAEPPAPAVAASAIAFEPPVLEVGEVAVGVASRFEVALRNASSAAVMVTGAVPNCGCVRSTWPDAAIPANGAATVVVTIEPTATQAGEALRKKVTYLVDGGAPATLEITGRVLAADAVPAPAPATGAKGATGGDAATPAAPPLPAGAPVFRRVDPPIQPGVRIRFPELADWIRGTPESAFEPGRIYVFEFFGTDCSHCREYAPLIESVERRFRESGVRFIAVTDDTRAEVEAWLALPAQATNAADAVVSDPDRSALALQNGTFRAFTPRFFVVKDGVLLWFGHPKESAPVLEQVVAGTFDPATVRDEAIVESVVARAKNFLEGLTRESMATGDWPRYLAALDTVREAIPERAYNYEVMRFNVMLGRMQAVEEGYAYGRELAARYRDEMKVLRTIARSILTGPYVPRRDIGLALELARRADELAGGNDALAANTLAHAYFASGDREKAGEAAERAMRLEPDDTLRNRYISDMMKFRVDPAVPEPSKAPPAPTGRAPAKPAAQ